MLSRWAPAYSTRLSAFACELWKLRCEEGDGARTHVARNLPRQERGAIAIAGDVAHESTESLEGSAVERLCKEISNIVVCTYELQQ